MTHAETDKDSHIRRESEPTLRATRLCAEWLHQCLQLGWPKSALDDLELLWWKWHDRYGVLRKRARTEDD